MSDLFLLRPVQDLPMTGSERTRFINCCINEGWKTIGDIPWDDIHLLFRIPNLGKKSIRAAQDAYAALSESPIAVKPAANLEEARTQIDWMLRAVNRLSERVDALEAWRRS